MSENPFICGTLLLLSSIQAPMGSLLLDAKKIEYGHSYHKQRAEEAHALLNSQPEKARPSALSALAQN